MHMARLETTCSGCQLVTLSIYRCESTYHLGCAGLGDQPKGEWYCAGCTAILLDTDSECESSGEESELPVAAPAAREGRAASTVSLPTRPPSADQQDAVDSAPRAVSIPEPSKAGGKGSNAVAGVSTRRDKLGADGVGRPSESVRSEPRGKGIPGKVPENNFQAVRSGSGGEGGGSAAAVGWLSPRGRAKSNSSSNRCKLSSRRGVPAPGKWPLTGDVRGCRCPDCVSILLQSGGHRPSEAKALLAPIDRKLLLTPADDGGGGGAFAGGIPSEFDDAAGPDTVSTCTGEHATKRRRIGRPPKEKYADERGGEGAGGVQLHALILSSATPPWTLEEPDVETVPVPKRPATASSNVRTAAGRVNGGHGRGSGRPEKIRPRDDGAKGSTSALRRTVRARHEGGKAYRSDGGGAYASSAFDGSDDDARSRNDLGAASSDRRANDPRLRRKVSRPRRGSTSSEFYTSGESSGMDAGGVEGGGGVSDGSYSASSSGRSTDSGDGVRKRRRGAGRPPAAARRHYAVAAQYAGANSPGSIADVAEQALAEAVKAETAAAFAQSGLDPPSGSDSSHKRDYYPIGATGGGGGGHTRGRGTSKKRSKDPSAPKRKSPAISRKGKVTHCEHIDRELYSRGQCKPCYMVEYWNRKHAELGLAPRTPRSPTWGEKKRAREEAKARREVRHAQDDSASSENISGASSGEYKPVARSSGDFVPSSDGSSGVPITAAARPPGICSAAARAEANGAHDPRGLQPWGGAVRADGDDNVPGAQRILAAGTVAVLAALAAPTCPVLATNSEETCAPCFAGSSNPSLDGRTVELEATEGKQVPVRTSITVATPTASSTNASETVARADPRKDSAAPTTTASSRQTLSATAAAPDSLPSASTSCTVDALATIPLMHEPKSISSSDATAALATAQGPMASVPRASLLRNSSASTVTHTSAASLPSADQPIDDLPTGSMPTTDVSTASSPSANLREAAVLCTKGTSTALRTTESPIASLLATNVLGESTPKEKLPTDTSCAAEAVSVTKAQLRKQDPVLETKSNATAAVTTPAIAQAKADAGNGVADRSSNKAGKQREGNEGDTESGRNDGRQTVSTIEAAAGAGAAGGTTETVPRALKNMPATGAPSCSVSTRRNVTGLEISNATAGESDSATGISAGARNPESGIAGHGQAGDAGGGMHERRLASEFA